MLVFCFALCLLNLFAYWYFSTAYDRKLNNLVEIINFERRKTEEMVEEKIKNEIFRFRLSQKIKDLDDLE